MDSKFMLRKAHKCCFPLSVTAGSFQDVDDSLVGNLCLLSSYSTVSMIH